MIDNNNILVSVIIPTYNGERTLKRAIKSVQNQTANWTFEILVIDDCSIDRTVEIAKSFNCEVIVNDYHTGGPNIGRNKGIAKAQGKYVCFLDQDDEWLPDKIKWQIEEMEKGADFVSSRSIIKLEH